MKTTRQRRTFTITLALFSVLCFLTSSCSRQRTKFSELPKVSEQEAWGYAEKSVAFGERHSGSKAIKAYGDWILEVIRKSPRFHASEQVFVNHTPHGSVQFRNLLAEIPGTSGKYILFGAHYDTKRFSFIKNFQGANDGASGVAALLSMISALNSYPKPLPVGFKFIFFDGEECVHSYEPNDGLHGSRHFVKHLQKSNLWKQCRAMILLDMIGDKELTITLPRNTTRQLANRLLKIATRNGYGANVRLSEMEILDDHVPFLEAGIPAINLIDFHYGPENAYWHTAEDSLDKISAQSIAITANLAIALAWDLAEKR